jgi:hypothetical protein
VARDFQRWPITLALFFGRSGGQGGRDLLGFSNMKKIVVPSAPAGVARALERWPGFTDAKYFEPSLSFFLSPPGVSGIAKENGDITKQCIGLFR